MDIDFKLWEGVWHIADTKKTFLVPYSVCNILDCEDFRDAQECLSCCVTCPPDMETCNSCLCDCGDITEETSLCVMGVYDKELMKETYNAQTEEEIYNVLWDKIKEINKTMPEYKYVKKIIVLSQLLEDSTVEQY